MLRKVSIENFKAIGDRQEIELKPINLVFGPNSAGKSSIFQALHYLREVLVHRNLDPTGSEVGGEFVDFNGFRHLINNRDEDLTVRIAVEFDLDTSTGEGWLIDDSVSMKSSNSTIRFLMSPKSASWNLILDGVRSRLARM